MLRDRFADPEAMGYGQSIHCHLRSVWANQRSRTRNLWREPLFLT